MDPLAATVPAPPPRRGRGYTLVELVMVVSLIAIVAAVAAPRMFDRSTFDARGARDELATALRYAQKVAVATGCPVRVTVTVGGWQLGQQSVSAGHCDGTDTAFATPVLLADGQVMNGTAPAGIAIAPAVTFDYAATGQTSLGADQTIAVGARQLTVEARSGLVTTP